MASESSSAVLELNDADTEDTDAPSVADDHEGAPIIMEHGYDIAVKVDAPIKQLSTLETFVTYRVRCACARWPNIPTHVRRRYNHFKVLHKRLSSAHPHIAVPPLPPLHSARQQLDRYSPAFVAVRTLALHVHLDSIAKHPILTHSDDFRIFCTTPDEEFEKVFKSENSALNLWGLSSALYGANSDSKTTNGARVKDPEFTAASDYLQSLQQKLSALCSLTIKLYKGSTALGNEYMGMKRASDAWSTQALGLTSRASLGAAAGAGAAAAAYGRLRPPLLARATLPFLAAYAGAHVDKIRQRDAIHAAHVSGNNTEEVDNRLSQASEALRSELADWTPKARAAAKSILLDIAERQVSTLTQVLMGWEHALKLSTEANVEDLFKTVSKTAVQNMSPSKCKADITPTETERDFDDLDNYSDSDIQEMQIPDEKNKSDVSGQESDALGPESDALVRESDVLGPESDILVQDLEMFESKENAVSELSKDSKLGSNSIDISRTEVISDPLQSFSEVDLSS